MKFSINLIFLIIVLFYLNLINSQQIPFTIITDLSHGYNCSQNQINPPIVTCKSINTAIHYYSQQVLDKINQPLNILIGDGTYTILNIMGDITNMDVTMSPFNGSSNKVFIDGSVRYAPDPVWSIDTSYSNNDDGQYSLAVFNGLRFTNFVHPIVGVKTTNAISNVIFNNCYFDFDEYIYPTQTFIDINRNFDRKLSKPNSYLTITNTSFTEISLYGPTFLNITYSIATINNSKFNRFTTTGLNGIFSALDSQINIVSSTFLNNVGSNDFGSASVLTFESSILGVNFFNISGSTFINNIGTGNGGIIYAKNLNYRTETMPSIIENSIFTSSSSENGGVLYSNGIPINIVQSQFGYNNAKVSGGSIYIYKSTLTISDTPFIDSPININVNNNNNYYKSISFNNVHGCNSDGNSGSGESGCASSSNSNPIGAGLVIFVNSGTVEITNTQFDTKYTESIYCNSNSIISIDSTSQFYPSSASCTSNCSFAYGKNQICGSTPPPSKSDSLNNIKLYSSIFTFLFTIFTIIIIL